MDNPNKRSSVRAGYSLSADTAGAAAAAAAAVSAPANDSSVRFAGGKSLMKNPGGRINKPITLVINSDHNPTGYVSNALSMTQLSATEQLLQENENLSFNKLLCYITSVIIILLITLIAVFYFIYKKLKVSQYYYKVVIYGGPALICFLIILAFVIYLFRTIICCIKTQREKIRRHRDDEKYNLEMQEKAANKAFMTKNATLGNAGYNGNMSVLAQLYIGEKSATDKTIVDDAKQGKKRSRLGRLGPGALDDLKNKTAEGDNKKNKWSIDKIICCTGMSLMLFIMILMIVYVYYIQKKFGYSRNDYYYQVVVYGGSTLLFIIVCFTLLIFFVKKVFKCLRRRYHENKQKEMEAILEKINKRKERKKVEKSSAKDTMMHILPI